jgi:hypothetical protein
MRPLHPALALLCLATPAFASAGVSCDSKDGPVSFTVSASYGRSAGSPPSNFNGEIEIKLKGIPEHARKIKLENQHLTMNWFHDRIIKLAVQWTREGDEPSAEVLLTIETRRGKSEDSAHRGRYALTIILPSSIPGGDGKPKKASGRAVCSGE